LVSQPSYGEEALRIAEMLIRSNAVDIIVVDSVAALVPKSEIQDGEIGDAKVGLQARLMSQAMRMLTPIINKSRTCLVFINQIRQKIGITYGDPNTTPGGLALKFYASVRMEVKRVTTLRQDEEAIGAETRVRVVKNKVAPPFRTAEFEILFDRGIDWLGDLFRLAVDEQIIAKSGAHFSYKGERLGHGKEAALQFLREREELCEEIRQAVLSKHKPKSTADAEAALEAEREEAEAKAALEALEQQAEEPKRKARSRSTVEN